MICLFCNVQYSDVEEKETDGLCGTCVTILLKQPPEILEGVYAKAVRKNAQNQMVALTMFIGKDRANEIKQEVKENGSEDRQLSIGTVCAGSIPDRQKTSEVSEGESESTLCSPVEQLPGLPRKRTVRIYAGKNQKSPKKVT